MNRKRQENKYTPRTTAEKVSLGLALLLLAGVVGIVFFLWLSPSGNPARFRVDRGSIRNEGGHFYLPITITNEGDATGARATVEGRLTVDGRDETATTTFDFVPGRSQAQGVLIFTNDPARANIRVISYQPPR